MDKQPPANNRVRIPLDKNGKPILQPGQKIVMQNGKPVLTYTKPNELQTNKKNNPVNLSTPGKIRRYRNEKEKNEELAFVQKNPITYKFLGITGLVTLLAQLAIWWIYPLVYAFNAKNSESVGSLFLYGIFTTFIGISFFVSLNAQFKFYWLIPPSIISLIIAIISLRSGQIQVSALMIIGVVLPLLLRIKWLNLRSVMGLVSVSAVLGSAIPISVYYLHNGYLTQNFIISMFPIFFSFLFYLTPIFVPGGLKERLISLVTGSIFGIYILFSSINLFSLLALVLIAFTWAVLINLNLRSRYRLPVFSVFQAITVILLFI